MPVSEDYKVAGFWDSTHPWSLRASALMEELIPPSDNCETLEGELLRAASRIHYDLFNNGWGCNNWSGAVVFLKMHRASLPELDIALLDKVHRYSHGEYVPRDSDSWDLEYYTIATSIMEGVVKSITDVRTPNKLDMFDFQEPSHFDDEEESEDYAWDEEE